MADRSVTGSPPVHTLDPERQRLSEGRVDGVRWDFWGPYLAERQWGTVREDYSPDGDAWTLSPTTTPAPALTAGARTACLASATPSPPLLRPRALERQRPDPQGAAFRSDRSRRQPRRGRQGGLLLPRRHAHPQLPEGRSTSTRSGAFPYAELVAENRRRGRDQPEYELLDTGVFAEDRYFDIVVEYAKAAPDDILIRIACDEPRPRASHAPPAADPLVPQHWSWEPCDDRSGPCSVPLLPPPAQWQGIREAGCG